MTVENQFPHQNYTANGTQAAFALSFKVEDKTNFNVKKDNELVSVNDYIFNDSSNTITFKQAPTSGTQITIERNTSLDRSINYSTYNNTFRPETLNFDLDRIWRKLQELGVADWLLDNRVDQLKTYVDKQDHTLEDKITNLKSYVDQNDQQIKNYLLNEIERQGVALDQLENYYNYLIKRIAEIAVKGGWDASLVAYGDTTQKDFNDKQLKHNERFPSVLDNNKVKGDNYNNDSIGFQEYFKDTDLNYKSSIYIPSREKDFKINEKLILQEPTMIYGDAGTTYNRGDGKKGKIVIGDTDVALDLGNSRTRGTAPYELNIETKRTKNPADNWTLKNIAFVQNSLAPTGTKTAIEFTSNTNGPDRGFLIREASATRLKHFLNITNPSAETQLANLVVENSCLSNNVLPLKATGNVLGARFVGNQMEQNTQGAISRHI